MARRIKLADVDAAALADADCICAVDPNVPDYYTQIWTLTPAVDITQAEAVASPAPANTLEVELDSVDPRHLVELKDMVKAAKEPFLEGIWDLDE